MQGKGQEISMASWPNPGPWLSPLQTGDAMQKQKLRITMCSAVLVPRIQSEIQPWGRSHLSTTNSTATAPWGFTAFRASRDGILDTNSKLLLWVPVSVRHHQMASHHINVCGGLAKKEGRNRCISLWERRTNPCPRKVNINRKFEAYTPYFSR